MSGWEKKNNPPQKWLWIHTIIGPRRIPKWPMSYKNLHSRYFGFRMIFADALYLFKVWAPETPPHIFYNNHILTWPSHNSPSSLFFFFGVCNSWCWPLRCCRLCADILSECTLAYDRETCAKATQSLHWRSSRSGAVNHQGLLVSLSDRSN